MTTTETETAVTITAGDTTVETTVEGLERAADALMEQGGQPLFDPNVYDDPRLKLYTKEGRGIDVIVIAFNGAITLNRRDSSDVELWKSLSMGREVDFTISGKIVGDALQIKPATDTKPEKLVGKRTVGVHTLEVETEDEDDETDA